MKKGPPNHPIFIGFSITEIYKPASYWGTPMESPHGPEVSSQAHSQIGDDHDRMFMPCPTTVHTILDISP
jgi:hypothetical protein